MLSLDGAEHRRHRTPFAGPYRPRRIEQRFGAEVQVLARDLVDRVRPLGAADLRAGSPGRCPWPSSRAR